MKVGVIGLGKLGLPLVAHYAMCGHEVYGYDKDKNLLHKLQLDDIESNEPDLRSSLIQHRARIQYVSDLSRVIEECDVISIIVPTPSIEGVFSSHIIEEILNETSAFLRNSKKFKLINIVSTVMPGTSVNSFIPILENGSGKKVGEDLGLCYSPEFIALGSVIKDLTKPDMLLIGANDKRTADNMRDFCDTLRFASDMPICDLTLTEAEIVKISINNFITTKISFANMIKQVSDLFLGTNAGKILEAIGMDRRIGKEYLKPGTPFGGPCFPRDTIALSKVINGTIVNDIPMVVDSFNQEFKNYVFTGVLQQVMGKKKIGVVGVTYKQDTDVLEESFGVFLIEHLLESGFIVNYWDSNIKEDIANKTCDNAHLCHDLVKLISESEVIVLPRKLNHLESKVLKSIEHNLQIIDLWT